MMSRHWLSSVVVAGVGLTLAPAGPPSPPALATATAVPAAGRFADWDGRDPIPFLAACRDKVHAELRGFRATLHKQERILGELHPPEVVAVAVRTEPYAARFVWRSGARLVLGTPVEGIIYPAAANDARVVAWRPTASLLRTLYVAPTDGQARAAARFSVAEAGLTHAADRTLKAWSAADRRGGLVYDYRGRRTCPAVGGRLCHVLHRTCDPPEVDSFLLADPRPSPAERPADAVADVTIWIDVDTGVQFGTEVRRADGEMVGSYFFRDVECNPAFGPAEFTAAGFGR